LATKRRIPEHSVNVDITIELWPIEQLIPRANNPRTHSRAQVAAIAASIQEFGWTNPLLVGADVDIVAGHARVLAARKLGMTEVPVILLKHLLEAQLRALVIADKTRFRNCPRHRSRFPATCGCSARPARVVSR